MKTKLLRRLRRKVENKWDVRDHWDGKGKRVAFNIGGRWIFDRVTKSRDEKAAKLCNTIRREMILSELNYLRSKRWDGKNKIRRIRSLVRRQKKETVRA